MRGSLVYNVILSLVILAALLTAFSIFITDVRLTTPVQLDEKTKVFIEQERNVIQPIEEDMQSAYETLSSIRQDDPISYIIGGTAILGVLTTVLTSVPALFTTSVGGITAYFGLPDWLSTTISLIFMVMLVFGVLSWLYGRRRL